MLIARFEIISDVLCLMFLNTFVWLKVVCGAFIPGAIAGLAGVPLGAVALHRCRGHHPGGKHHPPRGPVVQTFTKIKGMLDDLSKVHLHHKTADVLLYTMFCVFYFVNQILGACLQAFTFVQEIILRWAYSSKTI